MAFQPKLPPLNPPLEVIISGQGVRPANGRSYRTYRSSVITSTRIGGKIDISHKIITYQVGRRFDTATEALKIADDSICRVTSGFSTASINFISDEITGLHPLAGYFPRTNLAGVVYRIAMGLSSWSLYNNVNTASLRDRPYTIYDLSVLDPHFPSPPDNMVLLPRLFSTTNTPFVFEVIASAVIGEGGIVVTDALDLDANGVPFIYDCDTSVFPRACVDALRHLGAMFEECNAGDQYAYAFTKGIHSVLSVASHTDEGGFLQDVFRRNVFYPPYGGVLSKLPIYTGIQAYPGGCRVSTVSSYVDTIALKTAALVSHADPGQVFNDLWFPSYFCGINGDGANVNKSGEDVAGTNAMAKHNRNQIANRFLPFARLYLNGLTKLFGFSGGCDNSVVHFCAAVNSLAPDCCHLKYASVTPFFWVEPTSLIPHDFLGSVAEEQGFAAYATPNMPRTLPGFENTKIDLSPGDYKGFSLFHVIMRSARTSPFLIHWNGHHMSCLGSVVPVQLDPDAVLHPKSRITAAGIRARLLARFPITDYLWTRERSPLCVPGEFMCLNPAVCLQLKHITYDTPEDPLFEHLPTPSEFANCLVTFQVGPPMGAANRNLEDTTLAVARARTIASELLKSLAH